MMSHRKPLALVAALFVAAFLVSTACDTGVETGDVDDYSDEIETAAQSAASLAQAGGTTQNISGGGSDSAGLTVFNAGTTGTCPEVEISLSNISGLEFSVSLDFGDGCAVLGSDDHVCSGSAAGSISQLNQSVEMSFDELQCTGGSLNGEVAATFDITAEEVELDGEWNLSASQDSASWTTDGDGTVVYDRAGGFTTITSFTGSIGNGATSWSATFTDVVISYQNNANLIPNAGTIVISGSDIPEITLQFDSDSPSTGEVEVSINGSPAVTVDLDEI